MGNSVGCSCDLVSVACVCVCICKGLAWRVVHFECFRNVLCLVKVVRIAVKHAFQHALGRIMPDELSGGVPPRAPSALLASQTAVNFHVCNCKAAKWCIVQFWCSSALLPVFCFMVMCSSTGYGANSGAVMCCGSSASETRGANVSAFW